MVEFVLDWYKKFILNTNEKNLLVTKVSNVLAGKQLNSCLEIGLGTSPFFAEQLAKKFKRYVIIEKLYSKNTPQGIEFIREDWEHVKLKEKFDVIIASHVIYYFDNKKKAIEKMLNSLSKKGRILFVVNGKSSDYGTLKLAFARMTDINFKFTYDILTALLKGKKIREYTIPSVIEFDTYEDLFETMRLLFDLYPTEYQKSKPKIIQHFKENIKGNTFIIDQKILEVEK